MTRATAHAAVDRPLLHPMARACLLVQATLLVVSLPLFVVTGISVDPATTVFHGLALSALVGLWAFYRFVRVAEGAALAAEVILATVLVVLLSNLLGPLQYVAAALGMPLIDPWLARADALLGIHVPALAAWTRAHPTVAEILRTGYFTLLPQFLLPFVLLGAAFRELRTLWEYVFHFHFCATVTVVSLALFPAECAFLYYGFEPSIDQTRFIAHFQGVRDGSLRVLDHRELEGMISFPSFHAAGGMMVTWAFRRHRWLWPTLLLLNGVLIAATFMSGAHYFVDVLATLGMFALSLLAYRFASRWLAGPADPGS